MKKQWNFTDGEGGFTLQNPENTSYLYLPLANERGMMSSVTPTLGGDSKTSQNTFALSPVSAEELHTSVSTRNFWLCLENYGGWSCTGESAAQRAKTFSDNKETTSLSAGILWQSVTRENNTIKIKSEITTFVPCENDTVELTRVRVTNTGSSDITFTPCTAVPIYGRSADNYRDHRHVTSLLHRIAVTEYGVTVKPTLSFDERGHKLNSVSYGVIAAEGSGIKPTGFCPTVEEFIGEGGSLDNPQGVSRELTGKPGDTEQGYEAIGAMQFAKRVLKPNQSAEYIFAVAVDEQGGDFTKLAEKYLSSYAFEAFLTESQNYWGGKLNLSFATGDSRFDQWMKWVSFQPILRRIYGCSFLPHHDYGRGGRGWRDLWQDCLALLLMEPLEVRDILINNFAGVRIDGTNATIIGAKPGEFIADRNSIARVWMDHGAWPLVTTKLYIDQTGDIDFLLCEQGYFKDALIFRGKKRDMSWSAEDGCTLKTQSGREYRGTVLEHLLVQNLTSFYNVGEHNIMKLDGADWNDALDMAAERGESSAFTYLYYSNLRELIGLLESLKQHGTRGISILGSMLTLLDDLRDDIDYNSIDYKEKVLSTYYEACAGALAGEKTALPIDVLIANLTAKADWLEKHLRGQEYITNSEGFSWFNSYYDNSGRRVDGDHQNGVRVNLTGLVFAVMGDVATDTQVSEIVKTADKYLFDQGIGGYRLCTDYHEVKTDLGRMFGFAYGHKENGAVFCHMTTMYANALYKRGFAKQARKALYTMYSHCCDFEKCRIYPGLPEYINQKGRGMYNYLTGSASWLLLTVLTEVFGVKGELGDLLLCPSLTAEEFDKDGKASVTALFAGKTITVTYMNSAKKEFGEYNIGTVLLNGKIINHTGTARISRAELTALGDGAHNIDVELI